MSDTKLGTTYVEIVARVDKLENQLKSVRIKGENAAKSVGLSFDKIKNALLGIGGAYGAFNIAKEIVNTASAFEQLQTRLVSMYGDEKKAEQVFNRIKQIAATTPFSLRDVAEGAVTMKAFGMSVEDNIKPIADLAAFMGVSVPEAAASMGRAFAGGVGAADILRERGILNLIKSFKGIDDLTKLTLPQFRKVLLETVQDPASGIAGATDRLSKTLKGAVSNLGDAEDALFNYLGSKINPSIAELARAGTSFVYSLIPAETHLKNTQKETAVLRTRFDELSSAYFDLADKEKKTDAEQGVFKKTIQDIQKEFPNYFKGLDLQNIKIEDARKAFDKASESLNGYIGNMIKLAVVQDKQQAIAKQYQDTLDLINKREQLSREIQSGKYGDKPKTVTEWDAQSNSYITKTVDMSKVQAERLLAELDMQIKQAQFVRDDMIGGLNKLNAQVDKDFPAPSNDKVTSNKNTPDPQKESVIINEKQRLYKEYYDTLKIMDGGYYKYHVGLIDSEVVAMKKAGLKDIDLAKYRAEKIKQLNKDIADQQQERIEKQTNFIAMLYGDLTKNISGAAAAQALNALKNDNGTINSPEDTVNSLVPMSLVLKKSVPNFIPFDVDEFNSKMDGVWSRQMQAVQLLGNSLQNAFDTAPDSFLAKLERGVLIAVQIANAIRSINQPGGNDLAGILGLAASVIPGFGFLGSLIKAHFGGTFINSNGKIIQAPHFAKGADFIVPPGYPNDSYPIWIESGERAQITPASQVNNNDSKAVVDMLRTLDTHVRAMNFNLAARSQKVDVDLNGQLTAKGNDLAVSVRKANKILNRNS